MMMPSTDPPLYLSTQGGVFHLILILASPAGVTDILEMVWTCCTQDKKAAQTVYQQLISDCVLSICMQT